MLKVAPEESSRSGSIRSVRGENLAGCFRHNVPPCNRLVRKSFCNRGACKRVVRDPGGIAGRRQQGGRNAAPARCFVLVLFSCRRVPPAGESIPRGTTGRIERKGSAVSGGREYQRGRLAAGGGDAPTLGPTIRYSRIPFTAWISWRIGADRYMHHQCSFRQGTNRCSVWVLSLRDTDPESRSPRERWDQPN